MKKMPIKTILAGSALTLGAGAWASTEYTSVESSAEETAAAFAEPFIEQAPSLRLEAEIRIAEEVARTEQEQADFALQVGQTCMALVQEKPSLETIISTIEAGGDNCPLRDSQIDFLRSQYAMINPELSGLETVVELTDMSGDNIERARSLVEDAQISGFWDYTDQIEHSGIEIVSLEQNGVFSSNEVAISRPNMLLFPASLGAYILGFSGLLFAGFITLDKKCRKELAIRRGSSKMMHEVEAILGKNNKENAEDTEDH